jgi:hypothetical protein
MVASLGVVMAGKSEWLDFRSEVEEEALDGITTVP